MSNEASSPNNFVRSTFCSANASCVEVSSNGNVVRVRNSSENSVVVSFSPAEWATFVDGVKAGEFDVKVPGAVNP
jgi:hypothetical protein